MPTSIAMRESLAMQTDIRMSLQQLRTQIWIYLIYLKYPAETALQLQEYIILQCDANLSKKNAFVLFYYTLTSLSFLSPAYGHWRGTV